MTVKKPKIAFVVQRNGKEVNGGAEYYCYLIAKLMQHDWNVEILTTCALNYMTWDNYYPEGIENIENIRVRRFKVDKPRDVNLFNKISSNLLPNAKNVSVEQSELWMDMQGPISTGLLEFLTKNKNKFDKFIFFTYLYATTYYGLQIVADKSYLVPTLHDELPVYLPIWDKWFLKPQKFIFNTIEEKQFLQTRFPNLNVKGSIVGIGVDIPYGISNISFRQKYDIYAPYILYIGRIDESKGCNELFDYFIKFKNENNLQLKLVLAGKTVIEIPRHKDIIHLGFIDEQTKFSAIDGCEFLINSSPFESLSIVLLEAWSLNKPVLVNAKSEVMVGQCKRSNCGLWYENYHEFKQTVNYLLENSFLFHNCEKFIKDNYGWDVIRKKYLDLL